MTVYGLALIAAIANSLPIWLRVFVASAAVGSLWLNLRRHVFHPQISAILLKPEGDWLLTLSDGNTVAATLQRTTRVTVWFTLLHLQTDKGRYALLLCRDSLDAQTYRLLRVSLKLSGIPVPPSG